MKVNFDVLRRELRRLEREAEPTSEPCPLCLRRLKVHKVQKNNENNGRPFIRCDDCDCFEWMDMPICSACGRREYEGTCKQGKNQGRRYRTCPGHCAFQWVNTRG